MTVSDTADRRKFARASWANVLGNGAKIAVEGAAGLAFGSIALVADAAHSVADLVASIVVLVWGGSRFDDPDAEHPHGHARIEPLTALFVGAVIVLLGGNLLFESVQGLLHGSEAVFNLLLIGALVFATVDMYLVYWYTTRMNTTINSTALHALAVDCLNDLYTTVAALIGVLGIAMGYPFFDALAGAVVSLLVIYQGITIARENLTYLSGRAAPENQRDAVRDCLLAHPSVRGIHDLRVFYEGTVLEAEAHVEVEAGLSFREAHDLETELVHSVLELEEIGDVHLHLDPPEEHKWNSRPDEDIPSGSL